MTDHVPMPDDDISIYEMLSMLTPEQREAVYPLLHEEDREEEEHDDEQRER